MKKTLFSIFIVTAMLMSVLTIAFADTVTLKETIEVPTNIQIQRVDKGAFEEYHLDTNYTAATADFIYKADIDMKPVRDEFEAYLDYAEQYYKPLGFTDADLFSVDIKGSFEIKIVFPAALSASLSDNIKNPPSDMYGFSFANAESAKVYTEVNPETGIISRGWDATTNTLTISVYVKSPVGGGVLKAGDLVNIDTTNPLSGSYATGNYEQYLSDITLEMAVADKVTADVGTDITTNGYVFDTVFGYFSGKTEYSVSDSVKRTTKYEAVQKTGGEDELAEYDPNDELDAVKKAKISATYELRKDGIKKVKFVVDGKYIDDPSNPQDNLEGTDYSGIFPPQYGEDDVTVNLDDYGTIPGQKGGYKFKGWSKTPNGPIISGEQTFDDDTTALYAVFTRETTGGGGSSKTVSVSFVVDGEDDVVKAKEGKAPFTLNFGDVKVPTKEGYAFDGWYKDPEMTTKLDNKITVTANTTVYGKYEKYNVPEVLNSGDHVAYIIGYPDGTVKPEDNITREEVTTIFYRLLNDEFRNTILSTDNSFTDVDSDRWSNRAISTMAKGNFVKGYEDGSFKPGKYITRAEFVTIASTIAAKDGKIAGAYSDISGHWAEGKILEASANGWISGYEDGSFKPDALITRAEVIAITNRLLNRRVNADGLLDGAKQWADNKAGSWYYYDILEATNPHDYTRPENEIYETWTKLTDEFTILV